jgi:hypothetical protein
MSTKRRIVSGIIALIFALGSIALFQCCLTSCTVAPQAVTHKVASSWIQENRIGYDNTGYFVRQEWVDTYDRLWAVYHTKLPAQERVNDPHSGISLRAGGNYHVTLAANRRFDHMNDMAENGQ